jgi:hypothetical protein
MAFIKFFQDDNEICCLLFNQILKALMEIFYKYLEEKLIVDNNLYFKSGDTIDRFCGITRLGDNLNVVGESFNFYPILEIKPILYPPSSVGKYVYMEKGKAPVIPIIEFFDRILKKDRIYTIISSTSSNWVIGGEDFECYDYSIVIDRPTFPIYKEDIEFKFKERNIVVNKGTLMVCKRNYLKFPIDYYGLLDMNQAINVEDLSYNPYI